MYENITYAELKSLPKEQKPDAWKELKSLYSTQKELAEKLGVSPNIVYNMISKYAGSDRKSARLEVLDAPTRKRGARGRAKKAAETAAFEQKPVIVKIDESEGKSFFIAVKKAVTGEDAQFILSGLGSTLLKGQKYSLDVKIAED